MSKKFNVKNALCTLVACGTTLGGLSAVSQSSTPVFAAEDVVPSGGDFQMMPQKLLGRRGLKKTLTKMLEERVLGGKADKVVTSDNVETKGLEKALYDQTKSAATKDCIAINDDVKDTRFFAGLQNKAGWKADPYSDLEYSFLEDLSSIEAVKTGFPKVLEIARTCSDACNDLRNVKQSMSLVLTSIENFSYAMDIMDKQLRLLPNCVENAERTVIYDKMITDSLETSIIGKNLDMSLLKNEKLKSHVERVFDDMKNSWKERLSALKPVVMSREAKGQQVAQLKSGKSKNNGKPKQTQPKK